MRHIEHTFLVQGCCYQHAIESIYNCSLVLLAAMQRAMMILFCFCCCAGRRGGDEIKSMESGLDQQKADDSMMAKRDEKAA
jgi:hypothetical protein